MILDQEQPMWMLMVNHNGSVLVVHEAYEEEKAQMGWITIARESDVLSSPDPGVSCDPDEWGV
jgi:hypothetical protein